MRLVLGVVDLPYVEAKKPGEKGTPTTTGKVAAILEAKYSVMGHFSELHGPDIAELLAINLNETLDALLMGAPASIDPFGSAMSGIQNLFVTYIDDEEIAQTGQPGVPTKAALNGVSSRFKEQKGDRRASFYDTGLYESAFRAWIK